MSNRILGAIALAALASLTLGATPAHAGGLSMSSCLGNALFGAQSNCVQIWNEGLRNPNVVNVPGPRNDQEFAEAQARERRWLARCKPIARSDEYGVSRYIYAARGCEFGVID